MKRALLLAVLVIGLIGVMATAQCGCDTPSVGDEPTCYTGYWLGVDVGFKLVVPGEYFSQCPVPETPFITGWRVETVDGMVIYQQQFPDMPKGHNYEMLWDQTDGYCNQVPIGIYRLVIQTTTAGEFKNYVKIQPWPSPSNWCNCWCNCCCMQIDTQPCCISHNPYIQIARCTGRPYVWGSISIRIHVDLGACGCCGCP